ncbi:MAG: DUF4340 domain-containing protein [Spirochaetales bacterium]|nr:DUF4340 domain-containing protein [Spirochaetales bacterium]
MNRKNLYRLIAIAVVLVVLIIQGLIKPAGPVRLAEWKAGKIDQIRILNGEKEIVFSKQKDGTWLYGSENFQADVERMNGLINRLDNSKILQKVTDQEDFGRYGLKDEDAGVITVSQAGKEIFRIIVGQEDASTRFSYIRLPEKNGVYLVSRNLREQIDYGPSYYREMDMLKLEAGSIERIRVSVGDDYELVKILEKGNDGEVPQDIWKLHDNDAVSLNQQLVKNLINALEIVQASDYIDEIDTEPVWKIEIWQTDGKKSEIEIFAAGEDGKNPVTSSGSKYKAVLQTYESKALMKKLDELKEKK